MNRGPSDRLPCNYTTLTISSTSVTQKPCLQILGALDLLASDLCALPTAQASTVCVV